VSDRPHLALLRGAALLVRAAIAKSIPADEVEQA
jgi:hypothetical protein